MDSKIFWINEGEILDKGEFENLTKELIGVARDETGTEIYWWSKSAGESHYCDIDCYTNDAGAMEHLNRWVERSDRFMECANFTRCLVLGEVTEDIAMALATINPHFMSYFGGFVKEKPMDNDLSSNIFWSLEGQITNMDDFRKAMLILTSKSVAEDGTLTHWWGVDEDNRFIVLENYLNEASAMAHLPLWEQYSDLFFASTKVEKFRTYSTLSERLAEAVAGLNPESYTFASGFAR